MNTSLPILQRVEFHLNDLSRNILEGCMWCLLLLVVIEQVLMFRAWVEYFLGGLLSLACVPELSVQFTRTGRSPRAAMQLLSLLPHLPWVSRLSVLGLSWCPAQFVQDAVGWASLLIEHCEDKASVLCSRYHVRRFMLDFDDVWSLLETFFMIWIRLIFKHVPSEEVINISIKNQEMDIVSLGDGRMPPCFSVCFLDFVRVF